MFNTTNFGIWIRFFFFTFVRWPLIFKQNTIFVSFQPMFQYHSATWKHWFPEIKDGIFQLLLWRLRDMNNFEFWRQFSAFVELIFGREGCVMILQYFLVFLSSVVVLKERCCHGPNPMRHNHQIFNFLITCYLWFLCLRILLKMIEINKLV